MYETWILRLEQDFQLQAVPSSDQLQSVVPTHAYLPKDRYIVTNLLQLVIDLAQEGRGMAIGLWTRGIFLDGVM